MSTMKVRPLSQRQGLNCTLSYNHGTKQSYRCRVEAVTWGVRPIMDEAAGRERRTAYPHRVAPQPFQIVVVLNGYHEFTHFQDWMMGYAGFLIDTQLSDHGTDRSMSVSVPSRRFLRKGVLKDGISFGDHVGSMVWRIPFVFEPVNNPLERNSAARLSSWTFGTAAGLVSETQYFYPFGSQLHGDQQGLDYSEPTEPEADSGTGSTDPSTSDDLTPIGGPAPAPASGARGDTAHGNPVAGPTEKTIPETLTFQPNGINAATGHAADRIDLKIRDNPPQPVKQGGKIVGYYYVEVPPRGSYSASPSQYVVFSSGNVALTDGGNTFIGHVI